MQHWYACQAEVAPRGVPMTANFVSFYIGAMHLHILQLPHAHHYLFPCCKCSKLSCPVDFNHLCS